MRGMWWSIGRCSTVRTIGGLLTIVCSTEQSIGKLGIEQARGQVLLLFTNMFFGNGLNLARTVMVVS